MSHFDNHSRRREFLSGALAKIAVASAATLGVAACSQSAPEDQSIIWRMRSSWSEDFPGLSEAAQRLVNRINQCCAKRLKIVLTAAEASADAFGVFDDVAAGRIEMAHTSSQFWQGKSPAAPFFASMPFGMTASEATSWLLAGEGLTLWRELYGYFGLVPYPVGNTGAQMAGWFKRELRSMRSVRGLKMRLTGQSAEVWQLIGGEVVALNGEEMVAALKDDRVDAVEWMGPWNDMQLGLHQAARNYYYPGWQEPGSTLECIINQKALSALPEDLQQTIESACLAAHAEETALMSARNQQALLNLVSVHKINVSRLPQDIITALSHAAEKVRTEVSKRDKFAKRVFDSAMAFREQARQWQQVGEQAFVTARG